MAADPDHSTPRHPTNMTDNKKIKGYGIGNHAVTVAMADIPTKTKTIHRLELTTYKIRKDYQNSAVTEITKQTLRDLAGAYREHLAFLTPDMFRIKRKEDPGTHKKVAYALKLHNAVVDLRWNNQPFIDSGDIDLIPEPANI
jgi:hypothetical protein